MTLEFRMDAPQPHLLDQTGQGVIGRPLDRPEGLLKVTGRAPYAAEHDLPGLAHGVLVTAAIARGRVAGSAEPGGQSATRIPARSARTGRSAIRFGCASWAWNRPLTRAATASVLPPPPAQ